MEKENDLSNAGSQLLHLLEIRETRDPVTNDVELEKIKGAGSSMSIKLSNVKLIKRFSTDGFGNKTAAYANYPGSSVGISEKNYPKLQEVALICMELKSINDRADFNFIEEKIFDWLIECYASKSIKKNLQDYIEDEISVEAKEYIFYFKILALGIESGFKFGDVEITHLSEDKIQGDLISFEKTTGKM